MEEARGGMEAGISPLGEVNASEDTTLAWDAGVDFVVGQDHGVNLDGFHLITIVTDDPGELDLPDLAQLLKGEG